MAACGQFCTPWNFPLGLNPRVTGDGYVPLRFEEWLVYRLHVDIHQAPNWPGEMDKVIKELNQQAQQNLAPPFGGT